MSQAGSHTRSAIAIEAADWYARLRAPGVSEIDAARFRAWLAGNPERRREFDAIDAFWEDLDAIKHSPEVAAIRREIQARRHQNEISRAAARSGSRFWVPAAAVIVALGVVSYSWYQQAADTFATDVGEQRTVPLADGSIVTLNTDTKIRLHYSLQRREVELVRGQANFEVARDADRAFVVKAGAGEVRALGTIFDVYKAGHRVVVTLIEGRVAVTSGKPPPHTVADSAAEGGAAADSSSGIVLAVGEQLAYTDVAPVKKTVADVSRVTAWRARKLDFSDMPLADAVAEANRYSRDQIVIDVPHLRHAKISGTFEAGKNDVFAEGLQSFFQLKAQRQGNRIILTEGGD